MTSGPQHERVAWEGVPSRRHPVVRRIGAAWRRLGGGGGGVTLIACSAGADSSALVLGLAAAAGKAGRAPEHGGGGGLVVAHVLHDLRPRAEAAADMDAAAALARRCGLSFVSAEVRVRAESGNAEGRARAARYRALARRAREARADVIATGHHADDQLETVLMALLRGAGPAGLAGVAESRPVRAGSPIRLIRPALGVTRAECEQLCRDTGVTWATDATNADQSRLRASLRARVLPELRAIRPRAAHQAGAAAALMRDAAELLTTRSREVFGQEQRWARAKLGVECAAVLGEGLRAAASRLLAGEAGRDKLTSRALAPAVRAIRDGSTEPREFRLTRGLKVRVTAREVSMTREP